ncbi:MAG: FecR domain-containing protein [Hyphomicrobiaceae bacterium]
MPTRQSKTGSDAISDAAFEEAAAWQARLREPDAGPDTHAAFQDWLKRDPNHLDAYDQAERLWGALSNTAKPPKRDEAAIEALIASARPSRSRRVARAAGVGLCLMLAIGAGDWIRCGGLDDLRADYVVPTGAQRTVSLEDGSTIELNTDTAIAIDLTANDRRVRLFRGEAYFRVAHDPKRPFIVETRDGETRVTGTTFNLRAGSGQTQVGLIEGRVRLSSAHEPQRIVDLSAGQEGDITSRGISAPRGFDAGSTTAWRRGQIVFFRTPLAEVVNELNRYHRGRIVILGSGLSALPVTGVFDAHDPAGAIGIIEGTLGVSSIRLTDALIILR